jgi:pimeloyl-ACP methyl ester carboxylesterase
MNRYLHLLFTPVCFLGGCSTMHESGTAVFDRAQVDRVHVVSFDNDGNTNLGDLETLRREIAVEPQTVVVFMHGWHGTAADTDNNVQKFKYALRTVRERTFKNSGRKLTGVYLTWNAHLLPGFAEYPMYFFTRARADAVARGEGIATVIKTLSDATQHHGREHFIVAGHSFGGRILGRVAGYHPELLRDVDLWLLANAADDSDACLKTIRAVNAHPYSRGRLPKLVWVTSAKDGMTGTLYEIAGGKRTPGHDPGLQSYKVKIEKPGEGHPAYSADIKRVSRRSGRYAHNIVVEEGLGGHGDVWSEPMIQIVDYYVLHNPR